MKKAAGVVLGLTLSSAAAMISAGSVSGGESIR